MDLWIRGQEKDILTRVNTLAIDDDEPTIFAQFKMNTIELGTYGTRERALEVLDDIQNIIRGKYATSFDYKTALKGFEKEDTQYMLEQMAVYEMPKE